MNRLTLVLPFIILLACNTAHEDKTDQVVVNPPAEGFNAAASDSMAIAIADSTMVAMGGRKAWDDLRFIKWNFFGVRDLIWDKHDGRVRIDVPRDSTVYLIDIKADSGRVWTKGKEITQADSVKKYVGQGKSIWINDSYWLVMPFKLKDSGVTLKYAREDTTLKGTDAHVLSLTFAEVGVTPDNKYEVFVDKKDNLVKQWSYFRSYKQDSASAVWPWDNYQSYNDVLISADRSDNRGPKDVAVYDSLPESVFTSFKKPALN